MQYADFSQSVISSFVMSTHVSLEYIQFGIDFCLILLFVKLYLPTLCFASILFKKEFFMKGINITIQQSNKNAGNLFN